MGYILKEKTAEMIRSKFKNNYIASQLGLSNTYVSLVLHRKRNIPKRVAYAFAKTIDTEAEINDLFDRIDKEK